MVRQHLIHQAVSTLGANPAGKVKAALHKLPEGRTEWSHALRPAPGLLVELLNLLLVEISCRQSGFKSSLWSGVCLMFESLEADLEGRESWGSD